MAKTYQKTCPECGEAFTTDSSIKIYCSHACQNNASNRAYRKLKRMMSSVKVYTKVCPWCGKTFETTNANKVYCDSSCKISAASRRERKSQEPYGMRENQMKDVERDMMLPPAERYAASRNWTQAQRKYAQKLYQINHGLFSRYVPGIN